MNDDIPVNDQMTPYEAATYLSLDEGTLERWRFHERYGPPFVRVGRRVVYSRKGLEKWVAEQNISGSAGGARNHVGNCRQE